MEWDLCSAVVFGAVSYICYWVFLKRDPPRLCGVYSQPGKWFPLKLACFAALYKLRQSRKQSAEGGSAAGYGVASKADYVEMDMAQSLPSDAPKAVDAVYFNGSNKDGLYIVAAIARRQKELSQTTLFLRSPELGILQLSAVPKSHLQSDDPKGFAAGGLRLSPLRPMKEWSLEFDGKLRRRESGSEVSVTARLKWEACTGYFDFDTDMSPRGLAKAIAREPWSRDFFRRLQAAHQTHYEQFGTISGHIQIEGHGTLRVEGVKGMRDHSYGRVRDWGDFHRYAMQFFHLEDGTCVNVGVVSMPDTMSRLEFGYVFTADGQKAAIEGCDLALHLLGETTPPPDVFSFSFTAAEKEYKVSCEVVERPVFHLGSESEAKIVEQMCRFSVNGIPGRGFAEWHYRNPVVENQ